uniref:Canopy FGF signaling regulator 4 n=1 Tax=Chelonoidis abingdonii TaxID=106734 RepID=A0A8C0HE76_CHEAB
MRVCPPRPLAYDAHAQRRVFVKPGGATGLFLAPPLPCCACGSLLPDGPGRLRAYSGIWARQVADTPTPPPAVCKYLSLELQETLAQSGRSKEVLELGQVLDSGKRKRRIQYNTSETRLAEALETVCERFLHYSVHAERPGSLRYAKGQSQTMNTLKNLANKGVKVDLGIPLELWDEPSVEVTQLKQQCETMLEQFEAVLEDWYFHHQETALGAFLCEGHVLAAGERAPTQEASRSPHPHPGIPVTKQPAPTPSQPHLRH